jgi:hypothetical protein
VILLIRMPFGDLVIGHIKEGNGFGFRAIGNQEEEVGFGSTAIGSTVEIES